MDINLSIRDKAGQTFTLKNSEEVRSFLEAEVTYWSGQADRLAGNFPKELVAISRQIRAFLDQLDAFEQTFSEEPLNPDSRHVQSSLSQTMQHFTNWMASNWIYRGSPFVESMLSAYAYSSDSGKAFLDAILNKRAHMQVQRNPPSMDTFSGILMAYEYLLQDETHLVKRRNAEKKSFSTLRRDLEEERNKLVSDIAEFRESTDAWRNTAEVTFNTWFDRIQGDAGDWFTHLKDRSDDAIKEHSTFFNQMADHAVSRVQELEELYREKLRLAAPAAYWAKRGSSLSFQGGFWAVLLVVVSVASAVGAGAFFWSWLHKPPMEFGLPSLQGVTLFAATAAAAVFLIRMLSKLTFSAFHLQRDAEEREQLTHLYLALIHEGALDTKSRDIVLQALFSRADSGLLSGDHSPTMPNPADIIAGVSRIKPS